MQNPDQELVVQDRAQLERLPAGARLSSKVGDGTDLWRIVAQGISAHCESAGDYIGPITEISLPVTILNPGLLSSSILTGLAQRGSLLSDVIAEARPYGSSAFFTQTFEQLRSLPEGIEVEEQRSTDKDKWELHGDGTATAKDDLWWGPIENIALPAKVINHRDLPGDLLSTLDRELVSEPIQAVSGDYFGTIEAPPEPVFLTPSEPHQYTSEEISELLVILDRCHKMSASDHLTKETYYSKAAVVIRQLQTQIEDQK